MLADAVTYGLILAGGLSSRMGQDKAELKLGEQTLLAKHQAMLTELGVDNVLVSGKEAGQIADLADNLGPLAGIQAFCHRFEREIEQGVISDLIVLPVDMPALETHVLLELLNFGQHQKQSCCYQQNWLPAYFHDLNQLKVTVDQVLLLPETRAHSMQTLLRNMQGQTLPITDRAQQLININTPEQWQDFLTKFAQKD